jgi:hypothetical protein
MEGTWIRYYIYFLFLAGLFFSFFLVTFSFFSFFYICFMIQFIIDKILGYTSVSDRDKIDRLLELDCNLYCNLGTDSTKTERLEVKKQSRMIYRAIKKIDFTLGDKFLYYMDK